MKNTLIVLALFFLPFTAHCQITKVTIADGNYSNDAIWFPYGSPINVSTPPDQIVINNQVNVTGNLTVSSYDSFIVNPGASFTGSGDLELLGFNFNNRGFTSFDNAFLGMEWYNHGHLSLNKLSLEQSINTTVFAYNDSLIDLTGSLDLEGILFENFGVLNIGDSLISSGTDNAYLDNQLGAVINVHRLYDSVGSVGNSGLINCVHWDMLLPANEPYFSTGVIIIDSCINIPFNCDVEGSSIDSFEICDLTPNATCDVMNANFNPLSVKFCATWPTSTVDLFSNENILVYPNPVSNGVVNLETTYEVSKVEVLTIDGKVLKKFNNTNVLNIADLIDGMYFLHIEIGGGAHLIKKVLVD